MDALKHFSTIFLAFYFTGTLIFALDDSDTKLRDAEAGEEILSEGSYDLIYLDGKTN